MLAQDYTSRWHFCRLRLLLYSGCGTTTTEYRENLCVVVPLWQANCYAWLSSFHINALAPNTATLPSGSEDITMGILF